MTTLAHLTDAELLGALETLVAEHRRGIASIVEHLAELDARGTHLDVGHPSLFAYCVVALGFSEDEACRRIEAARMARKCPRILRDLSDGSITSTNVGLLKHHLTSENSDELLSLVAHQTARTARERLAARFPVPDVKDLLRQQPVARNSSRSSTTATPAAATLANETPGLGLATAAPVPVALHNPASPPRQATPGRIDPLSRDRFHLRVTVSRAIKDHLEQARDLLRHKFPNGDFEAVLGEALELLVERLRTKKFGERRKDAGARRGAGGAGRNHATAAAREPMTRQGAGHSVEPESEAEGDPTANARAGTGTNAAATQQHSTNATTRTDERTPGSAGTHRRPRAATRREVASRDGARCAFVGTDGRRCSATAFLEFDHIDPAALGGGRGADNIRCLCRLHNQRQAERMFGKAYIAGARIRVHERRGPQVSFRHPRRLGRRSLPSRFVTRAASDAAHCRLVSSPAPPRNRSRPHVLRVSA